MFTLDVRSLAHSTDLGTWSGEEPWMGTDDSSRAVDADELARTTLEAEAMGRTDGSPRYACNGRDGRFG